MIEIANTAFLAIRLPRAAVLSFNVAFDCFKKLKQVRKI